MERGASYIFLVFVLVVAVVVSFVVQDINNATGSAVKQSCPKRSQASLGVDTQNCSSTFGTPYAEERTYWSIDKVAETQSPLVSNQLDNISYSVSVLEGQTKHVLVVSGQLIITNGGEQVPGLTSIDANLQRKSPSQFATFASAVAVAADQCRQQGISRTCLGTYVNAQGASLLITDSSGNDVTALLGNVLIPSSNCDNSVRLNYVAEFDIDQFGALKPAEQLRLEMLVTFLGAGARGNSPEKVSCTIDADCNGVINEDDASTCDLNEAENNNVRTVPTRFSFSLPVYNPACPSVLKTDAGARSSDDSCVIAATNQLLDTITKSQPGAVDTESVFGTAGCIASGCQANIVNVAELHCIDGRNELIEGSPAGAAILKVCKNETRQVKPGDYCAFTQGGWGSECKGNNPGCFRDVNFASVFPNGVGIGDGVNCNQGLCGQSAVLNGVIPFAAKWTSSAALSNYLPAGSIPGVLTADLLNPVASSSGVLGGQLLSATLSVAYDDAGKFSIGLPFMKNSTLKIGDLTYQGGTPCDGMTVRQALNEAEKIVSGVVSSLTPSQMASCLTLLNEGFDNCDVADTAHFK
jgi:hypothetical protein